MNCYLGMAASLASGLYGIKNKLTIPPQAKGDNLADHKVFFFFHFLFHSTLSFPFSFLFFFFL